MSDEKNSKIEPQLEVADLVRSARECVIVCKLDGTIFTSNPFAEGILGYRSGELPGRLIETIFPREELGRFLLHFDRVKTNGETQICETQWVTKTDRVVEISISLSAIRDRNKNLSGILCLGIDVGALLRLRQAERDQFFLASIVSSAEDAIISKDLDGVITSWNQAAEKIFGYTAAEIVGKHVSVLVPANHLDEEPLILERVRRGERIDHYETPRKRKDGQIINVSLTISPIRDRIGRVVGASKIVRDISERKRLLDAEVAQSFLGALVESAEDAIISKDVDGIVTSWNPGAESLFGYTAAEMIGKPIAILIPSNYVDEEPRILEEIRRGRRISHFETKRIRKDGSVIDVSLTVSPIRDSLGRVIGASKIARDITPAKSAEIRLREALRDAQDARQQAEAARKHAEEANSAKDEFLATVSHELRTPITAILGWTRMLESGVVDAEHQKSAFQIIDRNARAQAQLIEDLLDISRIISGKLRIEFKTVELGSVISSAIDSLRPAIEAKGIHLEEASSDSTGLIVGDAQRLQQVLWNLLSNAIKFTERGGKVRIEMKRVESKVELSVMDTGIGINRTFLPYVFRRFSQADPSITRSNSGLGVGLAIVKSLIELHGGRVSAFSEGEGKGATFRIELPIYGVRNDIARPTVDERSVNLLLERPAALVGLKILIVDDEVDTCNMVRYVLNGCGAIVETAQNASSALEIVGRWHPDMLISDIGLPGTNGYELIRILREERKSQIPAIALTAMARIDDRLMALAAGYQMHVSKPVEPSELIAIASSLAAMVDRSGKADESRH
jgi:PAS domain S-box-containing protein